MAAVIFDLDGVIIDSEDLQYRAYSTVLEPFGVRVSRPEYGREWIARGLGPEYAVATYHLPIDAEEVRRRKEPIYHELLRNEVALMPGAGAALARLGESYPLAVATNSKRDETLFVLERFGVREHFTAIITREQYTQPKPAPDAFLTAAAALGVEPRRCVVIEDTVRGVTAAAAAGCPSIAVPHDFTRDNDFRLAARVLPSLDAVTVEVIVELVGK